MYKYILENAGDIEWMALLPLILFTILFVAISLNAMGKKKDFVEKMSHLPLEDNTIIKE